MPANVPGQVSAGVYSSVIMTASLPAYTVTRKRMKSVRLTVSRPDGVVRVSAPFRVPDAVIEQFVASKAPWIAQQQDRLARMPAPVQAGPEAERLRAQMREMVPPLLAYWAQRMGHEVPTFGIRRMTSRWGTCNVAKRHITLNLELARHSEELLEYVIVHELAHLSEPSHNRRFYAVMDRHLPDWKVKRRLLNGLL